MNISRYCYRITFLILISCLNTYAQIPKRQFEKGWFDSTQYSQYQNYKKIPIEIRPQVLIALSFYPELSDTKIIFRFRKRISPLASRPRLWSTFRKSKNRTYIITISTESTPKLTSILFLNLPYNAQIGVLGHELGHITEYKNKSAWHLLGLYLKLLKAENVNEFEFKTDRICIEHGLGYQLYDWSQFVRQELDILEWKGAGDFYSSNDEEVTKQRYMNPQTIEKFMESNSIYLKN
ncbi:hypothetical protein OO010_15570 [Flavobacteriaceae bacterium KMM 6898]|nr:hypothetical protein [Flavobacteriaceae bacterium KMM 6898]